MKFQAFLIFLTSLITLTSCRQADYRYRRDVDSRYRRDLNPSYRSQKYAIRNTHYLDRERRGPPSSGSRGSSRGGSPKPKTDDKKAEKIQVWLRLDPTPEHYYAHGSVSHAELNGNMALMGGSHMDVVVGTATNRREIGLVFDGPWKKTNPNGDGAKIVIHADTYHPAAGERLTLVGELRKEFNLRNIDEAGKKLSAGRKYDHARWNCEIFARQFSTHIAH